jgi:hypothetical protein
MKIELTPDKQNCVIEIQSGGPVSTNAPGLDILMRHLAIIRSQMQPGHPTSEPARETITSETANMRWSFGPHPIETQARLGIMHPGYGWISIPLGRVELERLKNAIDGALIKLPKLQ